MDRTLGSEARGWPLSWITGAEDTDAGEFLPNKGIDGGARRVVMLKIAPMRMSDQMFTC